MARKGWKIAEPSRQLKRLRILVSKGLCVDCKHQRPPGDKHWRCPGCRGIYNSKYSKNHAQAQ